VVELQVRIGVVEDLDAEEFGFAVTSSMWKVCSETSRTMPACLRRKSSVARASSRVSVGKPTIA
jgi:hypothetical protein